MSRRSLVALVAVVAAGLAAGAVLRTATHDEPSCTPQALLDQGTIRGDGVFFAVVAGGCGERPPARCTVADGTGPIATELVERDVAQDCVAFDQFVGAGLNQIPGYLTGDCFARALVAAPPALRPRTLYPPRRCRV